MSTSSRLYERACAVQHFLKEQIATASARMKRRRRRSGRTWNGLEPLEHRVLLSTVTWTGLGDGTSWDDGDNWDALVAPVDNDDVIIPDVAATTQVTVDSGASNTTLNSLTSDELVAFSVRTFTFNGTGTFEFDAGLTMASGAITGVDDFTVGDEGTGTGTFTWNGGTISTSGTVTVDGGLDAGGTTKVLEGTTLDLDSNTTWTSGTLQMRSSAVINNLAGATFDIQGARFLDDSTGLNSVFNNFGTAQKTGAGIAIIEPQFNVDGTGANQGVVDVQEDTLRFSFHGSNETSTWDQATLQGSGTVDFSIASTDTYILGMGTNVTITDVDFSSGTVNLNDATYNLTGSSTTVSGGTANFNAASTVTNLGDTVTVDAGTLNLSSGESHSLSSYTQAGGTLSGSDNITVQDDNDGTASTRTMAWNGGTITGTGTFNVDGGLEMTTGTTKTLIGRTLDVNSNAVWSVGTLSLRNTQNDGSGDQGVLNINQGATFDIQGARFLDDSIGANAIVNVFGTVLKTGTGIATLEPQFNVDGTGANQGVVDVQEDTLRFSFQTGNETSTWTEATLQGNGTADFQIATTNVYNFDAATNVTITNVEVSSGTINSNGTYAQTGSTTTVNGGTLNLNTTTTLDDLTITAGTLAGTGDVTVNGLMTWNGGTITGTGTFNVDGGLEMTTGTTKTLNGRTLDVNSDAVWSIGTLSLRNTQSDGSGDQGVLNINQGAIFDMQGARFLDDGVGGNAMVNVFGTVLKTGTGIATIEPQFNVDGTGANQGVVDVQEDTLRFSFQISNDTSTWTEATLQGNGTADFQIANTNVYNFDTASNITISNVEVSSGTINSNGTYAQTGSSTTTVNGGTLNLNTTTTLDELRITAGTLGGTGDVTVNGPMTWNAGAITGTGAFNVDGGLTATTGSTKTQDGRTIDLNSNATWSIGTWSMQNEAALNINAGATLEMQGPRFFDDGTTNTVETINVFGTLQKTGAGIATIEPRLVIDGTAANQGLLDVQTDTLRASFQNSTFSGVQFTSADVQVAQNAVLDLQAGAGDTYELNAGTTITGLGTLELTTGTLNVNVDRAIGVATFLQNGGTVQGDNDLTINGQFNWQAGTQASTTPGSGRTIVNGSGLFSNTTKALNSRTLDLDADTDWTGGTISLQNEATFNVNAGTTLDIQGARFFDDGTTNTVETINVFGTLQKTGAGIATIEPRLIIDGTAANQGLLDVQTDTLRASSQNSTFSGVRFTSADVQVVQNAVLDLQASAGDTYELNAGTTITGLGTLELTTGIFNVNVDSAIDIATFLQNGGTVQGDSDLTINGQFNWQAGTQASATPGSGRTIVNGTGLFSNSTKVLNRRTLDLDADTDWTAGTISLQNEATFNVNAGTTLDIQGDRFFDNSTGLNSSSNNFGTIVKSAGAAIATWETRFTNHDGAVLEVQTGTFSITGDFTNYNIVSHTLTDGTYFVNAGGSADPVRLRWTNADIYTNDATIILDGANAQITNTSNQDALVNFSRNISNNSFTLQNGSDLTTTGGGAFSGGFDPNIGQLVAIAHDDATGNLFLYNSSATDIREFTTDGTEVVPTIPRPGNSSNDFDLDFLTEQANIGGTTVAAGALLIFNGDDNPDTLRAINRDDGTVLASVNLTNTGTLVGGAYHPGRDSIFILEFNTDMIREINPATGAVLNSFDVDPTGSPLFTINFGDIEVDETTGNLFLVSSLQNRIREMTPTGDFVRDIEVGFDSISNFNTISSNMSGLAIDNATGEFWITTTTGNVFNLTESDFVNAFVNQGSMTFDDSTFTVAGESQFTQTAGSTTLANNGGLDAGFVEIQGGQLDGDGNVTGTTFNSSLTTPGQSPGLLTFVGHYANHARPTPVFEDTFDSENGSRGMFNYTGFANWTVTGGSVDLVGPGVSNIEPGNGLYIDMAGTTSTAGQIQTSTAINLTPGAYTLAFDLGSNSGANELTVTLGTVYSEVFTPTSNQDFETITRTIVVTAPEAATLTFEETGPDDNFGSLIDDVSLTRLNNAGTGGALDIEVLGPAPANGGTGGVDFDQADVQEGLSLRGTLNITTDTNVFTPTPAAVYPIVPNSANRNGVFATVTGTDLGNGLFFDTEYRSNGVDLIVAQLSVGADNTTVDEGQAVNLDTSFTDPGSSDTFTATIDWGDGTVESGTVDQVANTVAGSHAYNDDGQFTVTITLDGADGTTVTDTFDVTVNNVAPTIAVSGDSNVDEGSTYTLTLGSVTDPGDDTVTDFIVNWGDGSSDTFSSAGDVTHTYDDGPDTPTITVDLIDEDGTHTNTGSLDITVDNVAPTAEAGGPYSVPAGGSVALSGSATDPGILDTLTFQWDLDGDGTFGETGAGATRGDETGQTPTFDADGLAGGTSFVVDLQVTDSDGGTGTDSATINIQGGTNDQPTADTGGPYNVDEGGSVVLDGSGSSDPNQSTASLTFEWDLDDDGNFGETGAAAENGDEVGINPTFDASALDGPDQVNIVLLVTDAGGLTDTATSTVDINNVAPTADAGGPYSVVEGGSVALSGSATDPNANDTLTFEWDLDDDGVFGETGAGATRGDETGQTPTFDPDGLAAGTTFTVSLQVTDDDGGTGTDTATVNIQSPANDQPTADTGGPYNVDEGGSVVLDGSGSSDPNQSTASLTFEWDLDDDGNFGETGAAAENGDEVGINPTFDASALDGPDQVNIVLLVTDAGGLTDTATSTVDINNVAPTADAGGPYSVVEGGSVALSGSATDPNANDTLTFEWDLDDDGVFGETGAGATRGDETGQTPTFDPDGLAAGTTFTVSLQVTDDDGGTGTDTATINIQSPANDQPTADTGGPYNVDEGGSVVLDGSGSSDPNQSTASLTFEWDLDDDGNFGETGAAAENGDEVGINPTFDASALDGPDQVNIVLLVTDAGGLTDTATSTVDINNVAPTADAGGPYSVVEGGSVALSGSATDPNANDTLTFEWDLDDDGVFGETGVDATRGDETGQTPTFDPDGLAAGTTFTVSLQVTDDDGGTGTDTATIDILSLSVPVDVTAITINDGQDQRSTLETISVVFNQDVNIADLIASSQIGNAVVLTDLSTGSAVSIDPSRFGYVFDTASGQGTLTIDLDSGLGAGGILTDGNYQLNLTSLIHAAGDNTNTLAPTASNPFGQLRGDFDGDGDRDIADRARLLASFGSTVSENNDHFDLDGNGTLNVRDYVNFLFG